MIKHLLLPIGLVAMITIWRLPKNYIQLLVSSGEIGWRKTIPQSDKSVWRNFQTVWRAILSYLGSLLCNNYLRIEIIANFVGDEEITPIFLLSNNRR